MLCLHGFDGYIDHHTSYITVISDEAMVIGSMLFHLVLNFSSGLCTDSTEKKI